jgi:putative ABC transport system substrate-binding protein
VLSFLSEAREYWAVKRREFITLLGGATVACPLSARAQQPAMPVVGFLSSLSAPVKSKRIASFGHGLSETGYVAGRDVTVEARMAEGQYDRLPALAADLVDRRVGLIAALAPPAAAAGRVQDPTAAKIGSNPRQAADRLSEDGQARDHLRHRDHRAGRPHATA